MPCAQLEIPQWTAIAATCPSALLHLIRILLVDQIRQLNLQLFEPLCCAGGGLMCIGQLCNALLHD